MTVVDETATYVCHGRCDDGSDETIASPRVAKTAAISGVGRLKKIKPIQLQVALKQGADAQSFTFSREWHVPRLQLHISTVPLVLRNISFLVDDDDLSEEDLLIGRPILQHLEIDSHTILRQHQARLNHTDCSTVVRVYNKPSTIGRLHLTSQQNEIRTKDNSLPTNAVYDPVQIKIHRQCQPYREDSHKAIDVSFIKLPSQCNSSLPVVSKTSYDIDESHKMKFTITNRTLETNNRTEQKPWPFCTLHNCNTNILLFALTTLIIVLTLSHLSLSSLFQRIMRPLRNLSTRILIQLVYSRTSVVEKNASILSSINSFSGKNF